MSGFLIRRRLNQEPLYSWVSFKKATSSGWIVNVEQIRTESENSTKHSRSKKLRTEQKGHELVGTEKITSKARRFTGTI